MKPSKHLVVYLLAFILICSSIESISQSTDGAEISRLAPGLQSMQQIEALPLLFPNGTSTIQFSSYDPSGNNGDGDFANSYTKYIDDNGEYVIFDGSGPGCLYRQQYNVWSKGRVPEAGNTRIKYYFDDEIEPRINISADDLFNGKQMPFVPPYTFISPKLEFGNLYYPLTFKKRLKITTTTNFDELPNFDMKRKGKKYWHSWYQFTALEYPEDTSVESWKNTSNGHSDTVIKQWENLGKDPKPSTGNQFISKLIKLPAGTHKNILEQQGEGSISSLKINLEPYNRDVYFRTHLRVYWDGSLHPAIDMPLANFFGGGGETYEDCQELYKKSLNTLMYGYNGADGGFFSYWPMPYWKSVRIELWNDSQTDLESVHLNLEYKPSNVVKYPKDKSGYFYAKRTVSRDKGEAPFAPTFSERGRGHLVGLSFYSKNFSMDGDEFTYIDDSRTPQIHGDGTEDDHNQGWGGEDFQKPLWGGLLNGYQGAYRLYLNDSYVFNRSITTNYEYSYINGENYGGQVDAVVFYYKSAKPGNLILTDKFDVGDSASEKAHNYKISGTTWKQSIYGGYDGFERDYQYDMLRDKGSAFNGSSEFTATIAPDNTGVKLRRRIYRTENGKQFANVYIDGAKVKRTWDVVTHPTAPSYQGWYDAEFEIPSSYTNGKNSIRIKVEYLKGTKSEINEFYYWVFSYADGDDSYQLDAINKPEFNIENTYNSATASIIKIKNLKKETTEKGSKGFVEFDYSFKRIRSVIPEYISKIDFGDTDVSDGTILNPSISASISAGAGKSRLKNIKSFLTNDSRTITIYANDQEQHQLSLYFGNVEGNNGKQKIEILDLNNNIIVPKAIIFDFKKPKTTTYKFLGTIKIRITKLENESTTLIPDLFFD